MRAFELALTLANVAGSRVAVCSVVYPKSAMWMGASNPSGELALAHAERQAAGILSAAVASARKAGLDVEGRTLSGDPADEIVAYAAATDADAIVMGTHGRSGIKHFVMGSVAEQVLRSAFCPVVVVRDAS